ncbi:MAG: hypothetical protein GF353_25375 [Candidatus Lokiarchaeota archaeon]|nr:hypothetical protein [Candidatus Lokiarchaeota archaeon]
MDPVSIFTTHQAALIYLYKEGVVESRIIYRGANAAELFKEVSIDMIKSLDIFDYYFEWSDFEEIHDMYCEGEYPEDGWDNSDLEKLLKDLIERKRMELISDAAETNILGDWYDLILQYSERFPDQDYLYIPFHGNLKFFLKQLFEYELDRYKKSRRNSFYEKDVLLIGKLLLIANQPEYRIDKEFISFVWDFIKEYNERHCCI